MKEGSGPAWFSIIADEAADVKIQSRWMYLVGENYDVH